jgi:hypothetical protein
MIDPNAPKRPGKMNIGQLLGYMRANPMGAGMGKDPMARPGMPPLQPMMMARAGGVGGAPEPMGAVGPTHGGTSYGGGGLSAPAPAAPAAPSVSNNANGPDFGFGHFGQAPTGPSAIDAAFGMFSPSNTGLTPADLQAYAASRTPAPTAPGVAVGKRGFDVNRGFAPGVGAVNAAGQSVGGGPAPGSDPFGYGGFANEGYGSHGYGVNPQTAAHEAAASAQGNYGSSSGAGSAGAGGSSKVVCTAMCRSYGFGSYRQTIWLRHYAHHSPEYQRGYHAIFVPLLRVSEGHASGWRGMLWQGLQHIARHTTADIELQRKGRRRDRLGQVYRSILEPVCFAVGWMMNAGR